jgi:hypothetical protein
MKRLLSATLAIASFIVAGCGGPVSTTPIPTASAAQNVTLAAATGTVCVTAQGTPQSVQLPDTGGVTAVLTLAQYDSGASGCQNITIATGANASLGATSAATRRAASVSTNPLISITLGAGLPANANALLQLTTVLSGATLTTDANVVFPDGTYNATVSTMLLGTPVTYSLIFTAVNGKLTVTGGSALQQILGSGAVINVYDRGVVPPGFGAPTPSPSPMGSASPTPSASSTPSPVASAPPSGQPANGTTIGSATLTISGLPSNEYGNGVTTTTPIVYSSLTPYFYISTYPGSTTYYLSGLNVASYRIDGCTGLVGYGGTGLQGTFTTAYVPFSLTISDSCGVEFFSVPASVVDGAPNLGFSYLVFTIFGPVYQPSTTYQYPPAVNVL